MLSSNDDAGFWDRIAPKYATDTIKDMAGYERTLIETRRWLGAADMVLELGCGTGTTALRLAPHVQHLLATDLSGGMIAIAHEKAAAQQCTNAQFMAATAEMPAGPKAGLDEAGFDAVLAFNLLHLVHDRAALLRQVQQALKPGGLFISKTPCLTEMNPLIRLAVPVAQWLGKAPHVAFFDAVALEDEMVDSGFTILERGRHGSGHKDARIFLVARKGADRAACACRNLRTSPSLA